MYPYIKSYLGVIEGVSISVISNSDIMQGKNVDMLIKNNAMRIIGFNSGGNNSLHVEVLDDTCVIIHCILPKENRFGIAEYNVFIDTGLFETVISGLNHGFYDRLIGSTIKHYVPEKYFSDGFKQATEHYAHLYNNGDNQYWGVGLQKIM